MMRDNVLIPRRSRLTFPLCFLSLVTICAGCDQDAMKAFDGAVTQVGAHYVGNASDERIAEMFRQANDACPKRMDQFTTLESVKMIDLQNVEFRYRVDDYGATLVRRVDKAFMKKNAVEHMQGNPMAIAIAERDLTIEHIYEDASGNQLLSYSINKQVLAGDFQPAGVEKTNPFSEPAADAGLQASKAKPTVPEQEVHANVDQQTDSLDWILTQQETGVKKTDSPPVPKFAVPTQGSATAPPKPAQPKTNPLVPQPFGAGHSTGVQLNPFFQPEQ